MELLEQLEAQGWNPRVCDVEVPVFINRVPCGTPTDTGDPTVDRHMSLPHPFVRNIRAYAIEAKGDSMEDMNISSGDLLLVELCDTAEDNQAVVAMVNGELTVKMFVRGADGDVWLVPRNSAYRPIHVREGMDFSI